MLAYQFKRFTVTPPPPQNNADSNMHINKDNSISRAQKQYKMKQNNKSTTPFTKKCKPQQQSSVYFIYVYFSHIE